MPQAVAEYQARQFNSQTRNLNFLDYEYARVPSVDSLAVLPLEEAAARWLEAKDIRWSMHRSFAEERRRGCVFPDSTEAAIMAGVRPARTHILGTVVADTLAYVLHDESPMAESEVDSVTRRPTRATESTHGVYIMPPGITTLRRTGAGWRVLSGFESMGGLSLVSSACEGTHLRTSPKH